VLTSSALRMMINVAFSLMKYSGKVKGHQP